MAAVAKAMMVFTSLIVCASFVSADTCDSNMMQLVAKDTTDAESSEVPMAKMAGSSMPATRLQVGDNVVVLEDLNSLKAGQMGVVESVDETGHVCIIVDRIRHWLASAYSIRKAKRVDKTTEAKPKKAKDKACLAGMRASTSVLDGGHADSFRGWYDVQGCGQCLDYCRWVGGSGSGGDPALKTKQGKSYWSCNLAGSGDPYTAEGHFGTRFLHTKCEGGLPTILEGAVQNCVPGQRASTSDSDAGFADDFRGWYDMQGCGECLDYCRWVGDSGSGGDPALQTEQNKSYWSCNLAGSGDPYTAKGHFGTTFLHKKCVGVLPTVAEASRDAVQACAPGLRPSRSAPDAGHEDDFRGWYDVQGCGQCLDYCRWVGGEGSGGDPALQAEHDGARWSCNVAGSGDPYTAKGHFGTTFSFTKCASVPPTAAAGAAQTCAPGMRATTSAPDAGFVDNFRGWYDTQGCGECLDYCRWVGDSGSGGDPALQMEHGKSHWSCSLAGSGDPYTAKGHFGDAFLHEKCVGAGATQEVSACEPGLRAATSAPDAGIADNFRGFYDVQGCGQCLDFCRWVGDSGSGGDPALQTKQGTSYWSCNMAGSGDPYTAKGHFGTTFLHKKCAGVPKDIGEGATEVHKEHNKQN